MDDNLERIGQNPSTDKEATREASTDQDKYYSALRRSVEQDTSERRKYAGRVYYCSVSWMAGLALIVVMDAVKWDGLCTRFSFDVSEKVMLALMGTTTVSVLGSWYIVMRYLFPKQN